MVESGGGGWDFGAESSENLRFKAEFLVNLAQGAGVLHSAAAGGVVRVAAAPRVIALPPPIPLFVEKPHHIRERLPREPGPIHEPGEIEGAAVREIPEELPCFFNFSRTVAIASVKERDDKTI